MKKVVSALLIAILLVMGMTAVYAEAPSADVRLTVDNNKVAVGDQVKIYVKLNAFSGVEGIAAVGGVLEYDTSVLRLVSHASEAGGNMELNTQNGKFIISKNQIMKEGKIAHFVFEVLKKPSTADASTVIWMRNVEPSDGSIDIDPTSIDTSVTLYMGTNEQENNTTGNTTNNTVVNNTVVNNTVVNNTTGNTNVTNITTNTNKNTNTNNGKTTIPKAGSSPVLIVTLVAATVIAVAIYVRYIKMKDIK